MTKLEKENSCIIFLILAAVILLYRNVIDFGFVWDDVLLIQQNPYFKQPFHFFQAFTSGFWKFSSSTDIVISYYRPLVTLMYRLEYKMFELWPGGYHVVNLILHLVNVLLVWHLAPKFQFEKWSRVTVTLLFALHPVQIHTVCFISCQGDLLAQLFSLLAIHFWFFKSPVRWMSLFWALLAMLSKEIALFLPIVIFLLDWIVRRTSIREFQKWILFVVWIPYFILRWIGLTGTSSPWNSYSPFWMTPGSFRTFALIGRILLPIPANPEILLPEIGIYQRLMFHMAYVFLACIGLIKTRSKPILFFLSLWFLITTLLIADWPNFNLRFSDQLLYTSMVPASLLLGYFVQQRKYAFAILGTLFIFLMISRSQIELWRNDVAFWSSEFKNNPTNLNTSLNYAITIYNQSSREDGCKIMDYTLKLAMTQKIRPEIVTNVFYNLGNCNNHENPSVAEGFYKKSLELDENNFKARRNLVLCLLSLKKNQEAMEQANILIQKKQSYDAFLVLGDALRANGHMQESQKAYQKSNELQQDL